MRRLFGNTGGLKANQIRRLENLYRRRIPPEFLVTPELARDMGVLSAEIRRQIGLLINRAGKLEYVIVGDPHKIVIPDTGAYRAGGGRLRGLRCVHTHLKAEPLSSDDMTDLVMLHLDAMAAVTMTADGRVRQVHLAHLLPENPDAQPYRIFEPLAPHDLDIDCQNLISALETELAREPLVRAAGSASERALLVSVTTAPRRRAEESLDELRELARSSGLEITATILQQRDQADPRFLMGRGKLEELMLQALQTAATLIVFDQELNPSQIRSITDRVELKVIDRTQLILDIFAQRAKTREGKLQVELAQLKYLLPRLVTKNTAMSRLTGGIGGRGPGETKLEINRRRVRTRIAHLESALEEVRKSRQQQKARRDKRALPVISIIGYTNAGKSTLLNTLTHSRVVVEDRLFATLDPSSRRLRFPRDIQVIITDTVGFIRDLPKDLMVAFRATLEELETADVLLHVIDASNPRCEAQTRSVERILAELSLDRLCEIRALNKMDRVDSETLQRLVHRLDGTPICARESASLPPLIAKLAESVEALGGIGELEIGKGK
jgi:GTP-binding protein HflX